MKRPTQTSTALTLAIGCAFVALVLAVCGMLSSSTSAFVAPAPTATVQPTPSPTPAPTPAPTPTPTRTPTPAPTPTPTPDPDAQFYADQEALDITPDHWVYKSPVLGVDIKKITETTPTKLVYFVADVHTRDTGLLAPIVAGKSRLIPSQIAKNNKSVLAITADFKNEPCVDPNNTYKKGIIIRNGTLLYNWNGPSDTLAILPGGILKIFKRGETTPEALLAQGVKNTLSFGPGLVRGGAVMPDLQRHPLRNRNPRTGVGMVAPGHYIFLMVEGRLSISGGLTLQDFAQLFVTYGCTDAYNFDGGQSAAICFMGQQLNETHTQANGLQQRRIPDMLAIGTSDLVK